MSKTSPYTIAVILGSILFWVLLIVGFVAYDTPVTQQVQEDTPVVQEIALEDTQDGGDNMLPVGVSLTASTGSVVVSGAVWAYDDTTLRKSIIAGLIDQGFAGRNTQPYSGSDANGVITYQGEDFTIWQGPQGEDMLDEWIQSIRDEDDAITRSDYESIAIGSGVWSEREDIQLFQTAQDLQDLGYQVISSRRRISTDVEYRRTNIRNSFQLIGNVRVIPPSGDLAFMDAAQYDGRISRVNYEYGYVVVGNQEKMDYAGGICGASSAIYQGIITNGSLKTTRVRNHTRWYTDLYAAYIDGELVTTPGIDSAVFDGSLDLEMLNTASHPIIVVMNYDGTIGGVEEVFTLGRPSDRQEIEFVSSYPTAYTRPSGIGTGTITTQGGCYTWMIGDEEVRRCYRKVQ